MKRFTRLYLDLDATNSNAEKIALLAAYLGSAPPADAAWATALFLGRRIKGGPSSRVIRELAVEASGFPAWMLGECHEAVGDLSETIALILPGGGTGSEESLSGVMERRVLEIVAAREADRGALIADAWSSMDADERFVFHKLLRGGFRVGVQRRTVARALSRVSGIPVDVVLARLAGAVEPSAAWFERLVDPEASEGRADRPYPFFLAHQLEGPPEALGDAADWAMEWKWDGVRAQLVRRGGTTRLWSRGEDLIDASFPEIIAEAATLERDCVLDGELLVWGASGVRPFAELQTRLGRTAATSAQLPLFEDRRVVMLAFDALELDGEDLRDRPWGARRRALAELLGADEAARIRLAPLLEAGSWDGAASARETSRDRGVEGLMLKRRDSVYGVGRARREDAPGWVKWKVDPYTVDAVLTAAQPGSGRRGGLLTDLTFGVWDGAGAERRLATFAKAYSGLTNDEIEELDGWIRRHTTARTGPVRHVEPAHVFEIAFEGIQSSGRHRSGIAVRFPRIARWRRDKPIEEADTLGTLEGLLRASGGAVG
jgi:DNA ligase-1